MKELSQPYIKIEDTESPKASIVDVRNFFNEITGAYQRFEQNIVVLVKDIPSCSHQQIVERCNELVDEKNNLKALDDKMIDIINLAGSEIVMEPMLDDYRMAFAKANMACDTLHLQLKDLKTALQDTIALL